MTTISDNMLFAYADGELGAEDMALVEQAIARDPALAQDLGRQMQLRDRLSAHYAPIADEPVPERFRALLEPKAKAGVIDFAAARETRARKRFLPGWGSGAAIAASLVVGLLVGKLSGGADTIVSTRDGAVIASGSLDRALNTQLASLQPTDTDVRIGLSFRATDGAICRTFEATATSGIACHNDGTWTLRQTLNADKTAQTEYRQANSAKLMEAVQAMMQDAPFDAKAEQAAREAGWQ